MLSAIIGLDRFSYYGIRGIAVVYVMQELDPSGLDSGTFFTYYSMLTLLAGVLCIPAGVLSDLVLKHRIGFVAGALLCILGYGVMIIPGTFPFLIGAIIALLGTSFTRVNVYALMGFLFDPADTKRSSAYTISYGAVNVGAALSSVVLIAVGEHYGFGWGCGIAAMTMLLALLMFLVSYNQFGVQLSPPPVPEKHQAEVSDSKWAVIHVLVLSVFAIFFWQVYEQLNMISDPLWTTGERLTMFGQRIDRSMMQYLNPLILIPAAVVAAFIFYSVRIGRRKLLIGVAGTFFAFLAGLAFIFFNIDLSVQGMFIFWVLMMVAMGLLEVVISPLVLTEISILGTRKYSALALGFYFMVLSVVPATIRFIGEAVNLQMSNLFWGFWFGLIILSVILLVIRNRRKSYSKATVLDSDSY